MYKYYEHVIHKLLKNKGLLYSAI